jgi:hypothetical protein
MSRDQPEDEEEEEADDPEETIVETDDTRSPASEAVQSRWQRSERP